jgi:hypothetical protein
MTATYEKIATNTLGSATNTLSFTSITGSYTDLVLICNTQRTANAGNPIRFRYNSDSGSNYSQTNMYGGGSSAESDRLTSVTYQEIYGLPLSTAFSTQILNIQNYSNATTFKTTLLRGNNAAQQVIQSVGLWRNTSAITAIEIFVAADNMSAGSTFTLYGIKAE